MVVNNDPKCDPLLPCQKTLTVNAYGVEVKLGKRESNGMFLVKVDGEEIYKFPYLHQPGRAVYIRVMVCITSVSSYSIKRKSRVAYYVGK